MLEHLPSWLGQALGSVRAGADRVAIAALRPGECLAISLGSAAFADGARIPERFTADGEGVSPPLHWGPLPEGTAALALLVEDADSPSPNPIVHAVVWDLDLVTNRLEEGAIGTIGDGAPGGAGPETGRNSYLQRRWLPLDPPPGHGEHQYVFQLFALSSVPDLERAPGRSALLDELGGRLLGVGVLTGTYSRDDPAAIGPVGVAATA
ncbi:MAG: YbhB/YbcL family Raf kinase inhibitor-like protein [Sphingomonas bacterium]|nr:YbhB/YbcL family Raf kinase inhibitor-like protein [Sphingomonas bacterium]